MHCPSNWVMTSGGPAIANWWRDISTDDTYIFHFPLSSNVNECDTRVAALTLLLPVWSVCATASMSSPRTCPQLRQFVDSWHKSLTNCNRAVKTMICLHLLWIGSQRIRPTTYTFITFRVSRRRREVYIGHVRLFCVDVSLCLSVPRRIPTLMHGPGCNLKNGGDAL